MKKLLLYSLRITMALIALFMSAQILYSQKLDSLFFKYYENNEDFLKKFKLDSVPNFEQYTNPDFYGYEYPIPEEGLTKEYKIQIFTPKNFVIDNMPMYKPDPSKKYTMKIFDPTKKSNSRGVPFKPFKWFPPQPDK